MLYQLTSFQSGTLVVGGDFNVSLTPSLDTSSGSSCLTYRALHAIRSQLATLTLHDTWRMLHPNVKDYTYFSSLHQKYTRIDNFFLTQSDLTSLVEATIKPMLMSDQHPTTVTLLIPSQRARSMIWQLDDSILLDADLSKSVSDTLTAYFNEKVREDSSSTLVWAAHKCVVRGEFNSLMAKRNKNLERPGCQSCLAGSKHLNARTLATHTHADLLKAREELLDELQKTLKHKYALSNKLFYEFGNKSGKILAAALQKKRSSHTIHNITFPSGTSLVSSDDIANQFVRYF